MKCSRESRSVFRLHLERFRRLHDEELRAISLPALNLSGWNSLDWPHQTYRLFGEFSELFNEVLLKIREP